MKEKSRSQSAGTSTPRESRRLRHSPVRSSAADQYGGFTQHVDLALVESHCFTNIPTWALHAFVKGDPDTAHHTRAEIAARPPLTLLNGRMSARFAHTPITRTWPRRPRSTCPQKSGARCSQRPT